MGTFSFISSMARAAFLCPLINGRCSPQETWSHRRVQETSVSDPDIRGWELAFPFRGPPHGHQSRQEIQRLGWGTSSPPPFSWTPFATPSDYLPPKSLPSSPASKSAQVQSCGSLVTEEQADAMLVPMEFFLMGYGLYRPARLSGSPRSPLSPSCISPELLSPESMGLKLKPIKTRVSLQVWAGGWTRQ